MTPFRPSLRLLSRIPLFNPSTLSRPVQVYTSPSHDPYLNLAIEQYLLRNCDKSSAVLFLYVNRPCVVIGRNQNPWMEVNLDRLRRGIPSPAAAGRHTRVDLVRRRSGGGTVFHDLGNVNWSVICPSASFDFDRNRHAEMVSRALRRLGVAEARVNERHDIVIGPSEKETYKVSGSAYKLITGRALHHGTCLLSSPHLPMVSELLRSPAEAYMQSKGVRSVRSPIRNVELGNEEFIDAVIGEFRKMYEGEAPVVDVDTEAASEATWIAEEVETIQTPDWRFGQTPQFTFSTHPTEEDPRPRPPLPEDLPPNLRIHLDIRKGIIDLTSSSISGLRSDEGECAVRIGENDLYNVEEGKADKKTLYEIADWGMSLSNPLDLQDPVLFNDTRKVGDWLNKMFGIGPSGM
ncbi:hypothetical protein QBC34DRAFT_335905 [Podospora aff. communis PSN243]|uniref:Putative lipoate-protein ligase A n=1 Tax=Podospora aff. communis PSN243 TaxID=3040156 RepID=A0AAV9G796_9PEZI|nr:hypothetical protein QBC34DRAFT_335905 [Podospora aff. communis PSN243]